MPSPAREPAVRWWWGAAPEPELQEFTRRLAAGEEPPRETLLKSGDRRDIWRLPAVAGGLLLKRFHVRRSEALRFLLLPSRARAEFRALSAFVRLGLPTVTPLAFGERRRGGLLAECWLVSRLVPAARTLGEAQQAAAAAGDDTRVRELARAAIAVTGQLHRHPWWHRDLHGHNLLLRPDGEVLVTDLHSAWRVPVLTRAMRLANLARLLFSMRASLDLRQAPALLRAYAEERGEDADRLVLDALAALDAFERDYVRGRTRRCLVRSTLFTVESVHDGRLFRRRTFPAAQLREDLLAHSRSVQLRDGDLLGRSAVSDVTRVRGAPGGMPDGGSGPRVIKVYTSRGVTTSLRQRVGAGRARSAFVAARRLDVLGLSTPTALALLERPDGTAVLVTAEVAGAASLRALLDAPAPPEAAARGSVSLALGHLVGRLARHGLRHHDLSSKNVLLTPPPTPPSGDRRTSPPAGWPRLWLIDLDNLRAMRPFSPRGLARMLGQLGDLPAWVSRTDRLRFARGYALAADRALPAAVVAAAAGRSAARVSRRASLARPASLAGASRPSTPATSSTPSRPSGYPA